MTSNTKQKSIANLVTHSEETLALFSNVQKAKRERMVCTAFLRCLGISFSSKDIKSSQDDPPDVTFEDACFEVRELIDKGRKRGEEYKRRHETLKNASSIDDILLPNKLPIPISYNMIFQLVTAALSKKASRYGKQGCSHLDALVYINLQNRFLDPTTGITAFDSLITQGWRSVSFVTSAYSHVIFAQDTASDFLKLNTGAAKQKWNNPFTLFGIN
jgi:hypothetical protein